jgi:hypothetical protein
MFLDPESISEVKFAAGGILVPFRGRHLVAAALQLNQAAPTLFLLAMVWSTRIDPKILLPEICMQVTLYTKKAKDDTCHLFNLRNTCVLYLSWFLSTQGFNLDHHCWLPVRNNQHGIVKKIILEKCAFSRRNHMHNVMNIKVKFLSESPNSSLKNKVKFLSESPNSS